MSRRRVLGMGLAAAAAVSLDRLPRGPFGRAGGPDRAVARSAPRPLASSATAVTGTVQRYRTRPDLAPAAVRLDIALPGQDAGLILMDSQGPVGDEGPMILDGAGELVWFQRVAGPGSTHRAFNLKVQQWRGKPVLTWFDGNVVAAHGQGEDVIMDTSYAELTRVGAGNGHPADLHAFLLTPEGTALLTSYGVAYGDLTPYGGAANAPYVYGLAQEIDPSTGAVLFEWRSDQHVALGESYAPLAHYQGSAWDYFHINSIGFTRDGNLLISGRNTWGAYKVDRRTGSVLWRLGGKRSDFRLGPGAHFAWQHDVSQHADGAYTVFDNGAGDYRTEKLSRALVLNVDEKARRASLTRQYLHPRTPLQAGALGSVELLPRGHVFVGWGIEAAFTEFDANGKPLLDGSLAGGNAQSYRAFRQVWSAVPGVPPSVAAARHGNAMTVFASWNGATGVRDWLVLGGGHPSGLSPIGTAKRQGFETVIQVPLRTPYTAVTALDAQGKVLGRSTAVAT